MIGRPVATAFCTTTSNMMFYNVNFVDLKIFLLDLQCVETSSS